LLEKLSDADSEIRDKKDAIKMTRCELEEAENKIKALTREKVRLGSPLFIISKLSLDAGWLSFCFCDN
jgi:hypothetical protein